MAEKKDTKPNRAGDRQPINDKQQYQKIPAAGNDTQKNSEQSASAGTTSSEYSNLPSAKRVEAKIPQKAWEANGYDRISGTYVNKRAIQSEVFDKISTVRRRLEKQGEAIVTVYNLTNKYTVRLYGSEQDYEYDIIDIEEIK